MRHCLSNSANSCAPELPGLRAVSAKFVEVICASIPPRSALEPHHENFPRLSYHAFPKWQAFSAGTSASIFACKAASETVLAHSYSLVTPAYWVKSRALTAVLWMQGFSDSKMAHPQRMAVARSNNMP